MKEQILQKAAALFNRKGAESVSLRAIAAELGISDGHLRYYFKTKEDILTALFDRLEASISSQIPPEEFLVQPEALTLSLYASFDFLYVYRFFFQCSPAMYQKYPALVQRLHTLKRVRGEQMMGVFGVFRHKGLLDPAATTRQLEIVFEQFFIISDSFIKYVSNGFYGNTEEEAKEAYLQITLSLFIPYCTPHYREIFRRKTGS